MKNSSASEVSSDTVPLMLRHLTDSPFTSQFIEDELLYSEATYDEALMVNLDAKGIPLHAAVFKSFPTSCFTGSRLIPGGYTRSGKYRAARYTKPKYTDKRAGK